MPRFRVRLNDPNSEHFRVTYVTADDADAAVEKAKTLDQKIVAFQLTDEELEQLDGLTRGQLAAHNQTVPYELSYVVERGAAVPAPYTETERGR